jgi:hypothetical protein
MPENKTKATRASVTGFLNMVKDAQLRDDCCALVEMMQRVSHLEPIMWGRAIIGFGSYHHVYESGREVDSLLIGFSPRKQNISIYLAGGLSELGDDVSKLGKYRTGKGCLYIKSPGDVNEDVLQRIFAKALKAGLHKKAHAA